jgi:hypothetical protein
VTIDGRRYGETPLQGVRLTAGTHRVRLENPPLGLVKTLMIEIEPGRKRTEIVKLTP